MKSIITLFQLFVYSVSIKFSSNYYGNFKLILANNLIELTKWSRNTSMKNNELVEWKFKLI